MCLININAIIFEACIPLYNNLQIRKEIKHQKEVLQKHDHLTTNIGLSKLNILIVKDWKIVANLEIRRGGTRKDGDDVKSL
jgi:hypothetical protein